MVLIVYVTPHLPQNRLPIDPLVPAIVASLQKAPNLVLEAPPGAGKTTRVPPALLALPGEVLVLEPRRIAARMAARRVAQELGEPLGRTVGYQVRFEEVGGPETRIRFLTEGVLTRRLLRDRDLRGVGTVVLDEFHERHLDGDLALALLLHLQRTRRPDLRLLVMSATLATEALAAHLAAPVLRSEGKLYPLEIIYQPGTIEAALRRAPTGDALVFLPGLREIRDAMNSCEPLLRQQGRIALPLHGDLTPEEQDRAVTPGGRPKVIFATNVAESSITIDGVTTVIDLGTARVASDNPWTGLPSLNVERISQASATQRAGRAARTAPGLCIRLYPAEDLARRPAQDKPEIIRREASSTLLFLRTMKLKPEQLPWLDPPPPEALDAAARLLDLLHADEKLTRYPVHPRLARLVEDAGREGAAFAARLAGDERLKNIARHAGQIDLPRAVLRAFPDRVAKRLRHDEFMLAGGGSAVARDVHTDWIVAVDIEQRRERGLPLIREWSAIEPDWLLDEFPERISEREQLEWNRAAERVDAVKRLEFERLAIIEERTAPTDASELLAQKALEAGLERFIDAEALAQFKARAEFAGKPLDDEEMQGALKKLCAGSRSFADLAHLSLAPLRPGLDAAAPLNLRLPSGRQAKIRYASGQAPWVSSRMQDFFGMRQSPQINGRPLVAHLLAPNQRPVQITQDLAGFWERHYPAIRRELMRKYPRHKWPEDPYQVES